METRQSVKRKNTDSKNKLLSLLEQVENNTCYLYLKLLVIYCLQTKPKFLVKGHIDFLDKLYIHTDKDFSKIARSIMTETLKLTSINSLQCLQQIENILEILSPGYKKKQFLELSYAIISQYGMAYLQANLATKSVKKIDSFKEIINKNILFDPRFLNLLIELYQTALEDNEQEKNNNLAKLFKQSFDCPIILFTIYDFMKNHDPNTFINLIGKNCLSREFKYTDERHLATLNQLLELYPELLTYLKKNNIAEFLNTEFTNISHGNELLALYLLRSTIGRKFISLTLFDNDVASTWINLQLIASLCKLTSLTIMSGGNQYGNESLLSSLLSSREGFEFIDALFSQKPELLIELNTRAFYSQVQTEPYYAIHNWCPFSLLLLHSTACLYPENSLVYTCFKVNPRLLNELSYSALCATMKSDYNHDILIKGDQCSALGLLVQNKSGIELLAQLLEANPAVQEAITAADLTLEQTLYGKKFSVVECLTNEKTGIGLEVKKLFINKLEATDFVRSEPKSTEEAIASSDAQNPRKGQPL